MNKIEQLQNWYIIHCNGDWEHDFGIKLDTLDNPGWSLMINLSITPLEGTKFQFTEEKSDHDWYEIWTNGELFKAQGDFTKLEFLISYFLDEFVPKYSNPDFEYDLLLPLAGAPVDVWTTATAHWVKETTFKIKQIDMPDSSKMFCESLDNVEDWISDFDDFKLTDKVGDLVEVHLVDTFIGVKLAKKEA
jgi:hypothetical protein